MMTAEEIDVCARKREPLPEGAGLFARSLYHSLVNLYREYKEGVIDKQSAKLEKSRMFAEYGNQELWERIFKENSRRMAEIGKLLVRANKEGCPICKQMAAIFDGRQREVKEEKQ